MTTKGIYNTLVTHLDKLARHNRQGSFRTKDRYYEAVKRFCAYLAAHYHLQKLENISGKHLVSYVLYLQEQGKSASTIKTDLSAIRFFHDKMSHPRYTLPGNEELGVALERRRFGQQDRTWTNSEFGKLIGRAMAEEREAYILALYLARYAGLRIHECFRMDTAAAERALRENALTVKGKGGKVRIVPIEDDRITMMLQKLLDKVARGHKLLVPDGEPTDQPSTVCSSLSSVTATPSATLPHRTGALPSMDCGTPMPPCFWSRRSIPGSSRSCWVTGTYPLHWASTHMWYRRYLPALPPLWIRPRSS